MFSLILNTLIFVICSAIGYFMAQEYKCRVINLQGFLDILKKLEDEILYRKTPLPEALNIVSQDKANTAAKYLFLNVSTDIKENGNHNFSDIWSNYTVNLEKEFALKDDDIHIISELGSGLGGTDIYGQSAVIQRAYKQLEVQLEEAIEANNTKGKMYKGLGIAIGLTIVIILI